MGNTGGSNKQRCKQEQLFHERNSLYMKTLMEGMK
jgi:hypothetical protein